MTDAFSTTPETADPLADLVGEGKKFKTAADLAKGKLEADTFIEQLKTEMAGLREELGKKVDNEKVLQELRDEIKQIKEKATTAKSTEVTPQAVSADTLKSLIATSITEHEAARSEASNLVAANNALIKHFGSLEKAQRAVQDRAAELGLQISDLKTTAAKSPTAFLKLVGVEVKSMPTQRDVSSSVNTTTLTTNAGGGPLKEGTKEYFDDIRAKNPKLYWTPKIQNAIFAAAKAGTYDWQAGSDVG